MLISRFSPFPCSRLPDRYEFSSLCIIFIWHIFSNHFILISITSNSGPVVKAHLITVFPRERLSVSQIKKCAGYFIRNSKLDRGPLSDVPFIRIVKFLDTRCECKNSQKHRKICITLFHFHFILRFHNITMLSHHRNPLM